MLQPAEHRHAGVGAAARARSIQASRGGSRREHAVSCPVEARWGLGRPDDGETSKNRHAGARREHAASRPADVAASSYVHMNGGVANPSKNVIFVLIFVTRLGSTKSGMHRVN
jgi:hypothetical protein